MNKNQKLLTAFLGGLVGILLSGYAYYFTREQHYWLLPIGVFLGSAIGYSIANAKAFFERAATHARVKKASFVQGWRYGTVQAKANAVLFYRACKRSLKAFLPITFEMIEWVGKKLSSMVKAMANMHPVNRALTIRTVMSLIFFAFAGWMWFTKVIGTKEISAVIGTKTKADPGIFGLYVGLSLLCVTVTCLMSVVTNISNTYEDQSNFFREYEKYNQKFSMIMKNLASDCVMFLFAQVMTLFLFALFASLLGYMMSFGATAFIVTILGFATVSYLKALKKYSTLLTFVTTLFITTISYFVFRSLFENQVIIWVVALCAGSLSGLISLSLERYLQRFGSVEEFSTKADDLIIEKLPEAILFWVPKQVLKFATPYLGNFMDLVNDRDRVLAQF